MAEEAKITFDANPFEEQPQPDITIDNVVQDEVKQEVNQEEHGNEIQEPGREESPETQTIETTEPTNEPETSLEEPTELPSEEIIEVIEETQEVVEPTPELSPVTTNIPEGLDKLVQFMQDTGGSLEDYVQLNKDFTDLSDDALLKEYYSQSKPHWSADDINDHIEDEFALDEEYESGDEISKEDRRKIRNKKEEIIKAKQYLEGRKKDYYENIKMNSQQVSQQQLQEQQAAEQAAIEVRQRVEAQNKELFSEQFQGFDFNTGDKKFRIKENAEKLLEAQNDLSTVLMEHVSEDGSIKDVASYHKAIYAFRNSDKLFAQAYQQGKADALKERAESTKNIDMTPKVTDANPNSSKGPTITFDATPPGW